jgi:hypothetical protein
MPTKHKCQVCKLSLDDTEYVNSYAKKYYCFQCVLEEQGVRLHLSHFINDKECFKCKTVGAFAYDTYIHMCRLCIENYYTISVEVLNGDKLIAYKRMCLSNTIADLWRLEPELKKWNLVGRGSFVDCEHKLFSAFTHALSHTTGTPTLRIPVI